MNTADLQPGGKKFRGIVVNIADQKANEKFIEINITPSARVYKLPKSNKNFTAILKKLQASLKSNNEIIVTLTTDFGDVIEDATVADKK